MVDEQDPVVLVYYETTDGDAGLAELTEDGLREHGDSSYGTPSELDWPSIDAFLKGADSEPYSTKDFSSDEDGYYYPDDYLRFKVIRGWELPHWEWLPVEGDANTNGDR